MVTRKIAAMAILCAFVCGACTGTEMIMSHDNPLDPIYDSGSFRLVLTGEATSATSTTLNWAAVFYRNDKGKVTELSATDIKGSAQIVFKQTLPTQADITIIKQAGGLSGFTNTPCAVTLGTAGSCVATVAPYKGYYIIEATYTYEGKSGKLYSNFAAVQ